MLGVIGGSGLYHMKELKILEKLAVETPFGSPSDEVVLGELMGVRLAFLPRHGTGHFIPPSEINFRANIFAMKKLGVKRIVSVSAVGSMKEERPFFRSGPVHRPHHPPNQHVFYHRDGGPCQPGRSHLPGSGPDIDSIG
jgi:hypothetical protein